VRSVGGRSPTPAECAGRFVRDARKIWDPAVAIVKRPDQAKGVVLLHPVCPRRVHGGWLWFF
jgi:hypothetical protein